MLLSDTKMTTKVSLGFLPDLGANALGLNQTVGVIGFTRRGIASFCASNIHAYKNTRRKWKKASP
jgi:hypothetical protein